MFSDTRRRISPCKDCAAETRFEAFTPDRTPLRAAGTPETGRKAARCLPRTGLSGPGQLISQTARKPNFVLGDHSSRRRITTPLQQPTRKFRHCTLPLGASGRYAPAARKRAAELPAYLVLLRVGFTMRCRLLDVRCALTAPFHPYLACLRKHGGIFSVALAVFTP